MIILVQVTLNLTCKSQLYIFQYKKTVKKIYILINNNNHIFINAQNIILKILFSVT